MVNPETAPKSEKLLSPEDQRCWEIFHRSKDGMVREFQVIGAIASDYKRWGVDDASREVHKEIIRAAREGDVEKRIEDKLNPDGTISRMGIVRKSDGATLVEQRIYNTEGDEPKYDFEQIHDYIQKGVIYESEALQLALAFGILNGVDSPAGLNQRDFRHDLGHIKEKIIRYYNREYQKALFKDNGEDRDGLHHEMIDGEIPLVRFDGADFKMLVHVRDAMHTVQGERDGTNLLEGDPKRAWTSPRPGKDKIPHGLSTSLISSENINIYMNGEIIFGFTEIEDDSIVTMSEEDCGSSTSARSRFSITGNHGNERLMLPDELLAKTGRPDAMSNFNEVVLDRFADGSYGETEKLIMPSCLVVFGSDVSAVTGLQKHYAKSFDIPIYLIDDSKYGGVHSLGDA